MVHSDPWISEKWALCVVATCCNILFYGNNNIQSQYYCEGDFNIQSYKPETANCCHWSDTSLWVILCGLRLCLPHCCRTYPVMFGGNRGLLTLITTHALDTGMPEARSTLQSSSLVCHLWVHPCWSTIPTMLDLLMPIWQYQTKIATRNANLLDWWSSSTQNTGCFCHISQAVTKWYDLRIKPAHCYAWWFWFLIKNMLASCV